MEKIFFFSSEEEIVAERSDMYVDNKEVANLRIQPLLVNSQSLQAQHI